MDYRTEHDSLGEVKVSKDKLWGAGTQRSFQNFKIGTEKMPKEIIYALAIIKKSAAIVNNKLNKKRLTNEKLGAISTACDEILDGKFDQHFPLVVWQTGSGTQTNMNLNEVIANRGNEILKSKVLHPNDDVNMSQSSNDTFPAAMNISALGEITNRLIPAVEDLINSFIVLENENEGIVKTGRTHLQDATPIKFSQEISGWRFSLQKDLEFIKSTATPLSFLALGGTAVGTGLNAPAKFDTAVAKEISRLTGIKFKTAQNKFNALSMKDEFVFAHGALKALACDLMKIANDIRWLSSGPRCGLYEIFIPENEPGSSIMPGKVNPTQCEAVTQVAAQVFGNDATISFGASGGNFQLNVFMPVIAFNFLQSVRLLADACNSFNNNCVKGIKANKEKMAENLNKSLMTATALAPVLGYENTAKAVQFAHKNNTDLKTACKQLNLLSEEEFEKYYKPEEMV